MVMGGVEPVEGGGKGKADGVGAGGEGGGGEGRRDAEESTSCWEVEVS